MRKSISVSFFSMAAFLLLAGIAVMGASEMYLVGQYFAKEKYDTLDEVSRVTNVEIVGDIIQGTPEGLLALESNAEFFRKVQLVAMSAEIEVFYVDVQGNISVATDESLVQNLHVGDDILVLVAEQAGEALHERGTLDGVLSESCYISARVVYNVAGEIQGYLFACEPNSSLQAFLMDMFSNFLLSASLMLLIASVLTMYLTQRMTAPLHEITVAAQKFGGGELSTRVAVLGDDEIAQLAENFNRMAANLEEADRSRGQFMGNIAHELRTPMTTIKGFVDGVLDGTIPPELQTHYLQIVSNETGRLARLVQNMLDVTKLEQGEYQVNARRYAIEETLMGAALSAEQRITDGGIEVEGLSTDKTFVYADPDLVHQVVYNLLDNAIKFTPSGGTITFHAIQLGPMVEVSIQNSGAGISEAALPFVFERFYKEDASRGLNAKGSGLGLHICKVLITLSGGQIRVESAQGEWCKFTFSLPCEAPRQKNRLKIAEEIPENP
ncbi:MAG: HAMP domain-containing sensor histidine kinase [Faecalibacterium sp.]